MLKREYLLELGIENILNYLRKSRQDIELEKRTGEDTLKSQKDLMDSVLNPLGIPFVQRAEIGSGDKISTRPVFQGVIEDLRAGIYQAIAVKEISRMGRGSYTDMGIIYDLIVERRIYVITPWKIYDPKNQADLRQIRFELFMSREEFETTRERLSGGRVLKALEGRWMAGKPPFGYSLDTQSRKLVINDEEAVVVRLIFSLYANGIPLSNGKTKDAGVRAIATYLKRIGIKTPLGNDGWRPDNIKYMLTNECYIGVMKYRTTTNVEGKTVPRPAEEHIIVVDAHEAIIDENLWLKVQNKLTDPGTYRPRVRMDYSAYELTGLPVCKVCGLKMIRQVQKQQYKSKKTGEITTYNKEFLRCATNGCVMVKYKSIEEDLLHTLKYMQELDLELMQPILNQMIGEKKTAGNANLDDISGFVERRTKELSNRLKFIYDKYESGIYTDEMFVERKSEIDKEMLRLKELSNPQDQEQLIEKEPQVDFEKIKDKFGSILESYHACGEDKASKNSILRKVFDHVQIEVLEKGRGSIPAKHAIYPVLKYDILKPDILVL
ncbi:recombinase family protein [Paenibacillus chitinolyticus]|uniref:recombinase family protein n=1 Tax=Paenibacillus chitinolyticus TaxID=79263 RepID=UPI001C47AC14|nr:recombinase family protein [Paenibacillus chitinolyticus]MBV6712285.1 recombinase family protein [Paenibacillus chitinolyticus]